MADEEDVDGDYDDDIDSELVEQLKARCKKLVDAAVNGLMEHFDSVQIFVIAHRPPEVPKGTFSYQTGDGNRYARYGQIRQWVIKEEKQSTEDEEL